MTIPVRKSGLNRTSPFGYTCGRCQACCRFKKIQLNPYEIARLARNRGLTTTEFIDQYTTNGGTLLRFREDDSCVFLNAQGCSVYPDRPLVCRLYPLGRHVPRSAAEYFNQMVREPSCRGRFHENGTIEAYLEEQGAGPFLHAADLYLELLWRLLERLQEEPLAASHAENLVETVRQVRDRPEGGHDLAWIDMDRAVADYCRQSGLSVPDALEAKMALHIEAVRSWAA